jgi:hypothetical protein
MPYVACCMLLVVRRGLAGWRPGDGSAGFRQRWRTPAHTCTGTGTATSVLGLGSPRPTSAPGLRRCIPDDSRAAASDGRTPKQTRRIVRCARFECGLLARASSAAGLGSPRPYLHRDWDHPGLVYTGAGLAPYHICTRTGLTPANICTKTATSAPGLGSSPPPSAPRLGSPPPASPPRLPHLHQDWAHPAPSAPGLPHLHWDWARSSPHLLRRGRGEPQSRCRYGWVEPGLGADVAGVSPVFGGCRRDGGGREQILPSHGARALFAS